jgi:hypothetical protein
MVTGGLAMAQHDLTGQFQGMQRCINIGARRLVAIAAHLEVRSGLSGAEALTDLGVEPRLIGSYARDVSIWPGKDVDLFGLSTAPGTLGPQQLYNRFGMALDGYRRAGRLRPQPRSFQIDFGDGAGERTRYPSREFIQTAATDYGLDDDLVNEAETEIERGFPFHVDAVPARPHGQHYQIPQTSTIVLGSGERQRMLSREWVDTDPLGLNDETTRVNGLVTIGGQGAYVPTVKAIRQFKSAHLRRVKPSSLFYEFILLEGFDAACISGDTWADVTAAAFEYLNARMATLDTSPVCDPILRQPYAPLPSAEDRMTATAAVRDALRSARRAVDATDRCSAALAWRSVFGGNGRREHVFPMPDGCDGAATAYGPAGAGLDRAR